MFEAGDAVVHPVRGAGVVERIVEREWHGSRKLYYQIALLSDPGTRLMIPAGVADELGLRHAATKAKLERVWVVLHKSPAELPTDHRERYKILADKLSSGEILEVAETVRDLAWRQKVVGHLTIKGKRLYEQATALLAGEVAAAKGISFAEAESTIRMELGEVLGRPSLH